MNLMKKLIKNIFFKYYKKLKNIFKKISLILYCMETTNKNKVSKYDYLKQWRNNNKDRYKMHKKKENDLRRDFKIYRFINLIN